MGEDAVTITHQSYNPVRQVSFYRDVASTEYVLAGPTEDSLAPTIARLRLSYPNMNVVVGSPYMFCGEVQIVVTVLPR